MATGTEPHDHACWQPVANDSTPIRVVHDKFVPLNAPSSTLPQFHPHQDWRWTHLNDQMRTSVNFGVTPTRKRSTSPSNRSSLIAMRFTGERRDSDGTTQLLSKEFIYIAISVFKLKSSKNNAITKKYLLILTTFDPRVLTAFERKYTNDLQQTPNFFRQLSLCERHLSSTRAHMIWQTHQLDQTQQNWTLEWTILNRSFQFRSDGHLSNDFVWFS